MNHVSIWRHLGRPEANRLFYPASPLDLVNSFAFCQFAVSMRLQQPVIYSLVLLGFACTVAAHLPSPPQCAVSTLLTRLGISNKIKIDCQQQLLARETTCSSTDTSCLCADENYQSALSTCVTANCTMKDALRKLLHLTRSFILI